MRGYYKEVVSIMLGIRLTTNNFKLSNYKIEVVFFYDIACVGDSFGDSID